MIAWMIVLAAVVASAQSAVFGKWALAKIAYSRKFGAVSCFAGDTVEMVEVIENAKPLPVPWLRAESAISANLRFQHQADLDIDRGQAFQHHKSLFTLMPSRRIRRRHKVTCARRGVYRLESVTVSAGDLFGLTVSTRSIPTPSSLTVYPRLVPLGELPLPSHDWQGDIIVRRWIVEDPFLYAGVREYRPGDAMSRISWKAVARTGELQVHRHDYTANRRLYIYVNVETAETMRGQVPNEELIEKGISYAATLTAEAIAAGLPVGFGHNAHSLDHTAGFTRIEAQGGKAHLQTILEAMARMLLKHKFMFHDLLEDAAGSLERCDYVLITAHVSAAIADRVARLRNAGHGVELLMLRKETERAGREANDRGNSHCSAGGLQR